MHCFAIGIPPISLPDDLDNCPICLSSKIHRAPWGKLDTHHATWCYQGISIDFGFFVQRSSDPNRIHQLQGLNGETCYCLIACHHSGMLFGESFCSKTPPVDFLNRWLARYALTSDIPDKYVHMDQGGELGRCPEIVALFESAGYAIELTAPDSSHQNGPGEQPHCTIGDAIQMMLAGADLEPHFWPYAFRHFLRLYNVTPHHSHDASPHMICSGHLPDLSLLRTFTRVGIFLGYSQTLKNILYYDTTTHRVKTALHVVFDESMTDSDNKSPNARLLCGEVFPPTDIINATSGLPSLEITSSPFTLFVMIDMPYDHSNTIPFGFEVSTCPRLRRVYVSSFTRTPIGHTLRATRHMLLGSYVVSIFDHPVFSASDLVMIHNLIGSQPITLMLISVVLALECHSSFDDRSTPTQLCVYDLHHVSALWSLTREGTMIDFNRAVSTYLDSVSSNQMELIVN